MDATYGAYVAAENRTFNNTGNNANENNHANYCSNNYILGQWRTSPDTNEHPMRRKTPRIRPRGCFFMLRSILMLPGLKIPFKSENLTKNQISKKVGFQNMMK